ncbi:DUF3710 domain-containing protein [Allostreptomyces psammosilenae]|uniref:DUF3710 domain-containing protein n=1 Tax=Allostreptomyces psammosilenae TaxID=1892865 RepID=A0A852ZNA3_9ACTN|nr:DUF3710 domain-containing protein [Allostreptomyces psammosilenae]NYI03145.1 hypothetical protein [Allostreptomyces psammosilenae]
MFRRRRRQDADDRLAEGAERSGEQVEEEGKEETEDAPRRVGLPPAPRPDGPWDISEVDEPGEGRVDLGGLLVPGVEGMELRVEVAGDSIVAATIVLGQSAIQLQAFAAPRSEGLWSEIREEIAAGISKQGGTADPVDGPLGLELRARVPVRLPDGSSGVQLVRFVGCDGPRWFLRGVISGQAAVQPESSEVLEGVFRGTVVVRGDAPMAPRDPIVLRLPEDAQMVADGGTRRRPTGAPGQDAQAQGQGNASRFSGGSLDPFRRGPEITEVR